MNILAKIQTRAYSTLLVVVIGLASTQLNAQTGPSQSEIDAFKGLFLASHTGNLAQLKKLIEAGSPLEAEDDFGRTALLIAAYASHEEIVVALATAGANMNTLERQAYDIVTIAAVVNDLPMLEVALKNGASSGNVTSPYDGTALIAAAHLGHHEVVKRLIDAGAPLDHVNNLNWTALIEAVILGDGGPDHIATVKHLVTAGANKSISDRNNETPLDLARTHGYQEIVSILEQGQ